MSAGVQPRASHEKRSALRTEGLARIALVVLGSAWVLYFDLIYGAAGSEGPGALLLLLVALAAWRYGMLGELVGTAVGWASFVLLSTRCLNQTVAQFLDPGVGAGLAAVLIAAVFVGMTRDMYTRLRQEQRAHREADLLLYASEARFRSVYRESRVAIALLDQDGVTREANPAAFAMLGVQDEAALRGFSVFSAREITPDHHKGLEEGRTVRLPLSLAFDDVRKAGLLDSGHSGSVIAEVTITPREGGASFILMALDVTAREKLIAELQEALSKVKQLSGLIPICANCKKIRNDKGYWEAVDMYVHAHSGAEFTHGICPDCFRRLYPDFVDEICSPGQAHPSE